MNVSELVIRRRVTIVVVVLGVIALGATSYRRLSVNQRATVDHPTITVQASLPGASPETMASAVVTPLEQQFSMIAGVDSMTSTSSLGASVITIQFSIARNIDAAAQDVEAMIAKTLKDLPAGIVVDRQSRSAPDAHAEAK